MLVPTQRITQFRVRTATGRRKTALQPMLRSGRVSKVTHNDRQFLQIFRRKAHPIKPTPKEARMTAPAHQLGRIAKRRRAKGSNKQGKAYPEQARSHDSGATRTTKTRAIIATFMTAAELLQRVSVPSRKLATQACLGSKRFHMF